MKVFNDSLKTIMKFHKLKFSMIVIYTVVKSIAHMKLA